jgi:hypothetical protein
MGLLFTFYAHAFEQRGDKVLCVQKPVNDAYSSSTMQLEDGKQYPRALSVETPDGKFKIFGHNHLPPGFDRTSFTDVALDRKSSNGDFLKTLNDLAAKGKRVTDQRLGDLNRLESNGAGTLFTEETDKQDQIAKEDLQTEYILFQKNMTDRGLLPGHEDVFNHVSALMYGESYLYKYRNPSTKVVPTGNQDLFDQSENAMGVRNSGISGLRNLASQGRLSPDQVSAFEKKLTDFGYSMMNDTKIDNHEAEAEKLQNSISDPTARGMAKRAIDGELQFQKALLERDKDMVDQITKGKSISADRTLHLGGYHVPRIAKLLQEKCRQDIQAANKEILDMYKGRNIDPKVLKPFLYRIDVTQ